MYTCNSCMYVYICRPMYICMYISEMKCYTCRRRESYNSFLFLVLT